MNSTPTVNISIDPLLGSFVVTQGVLVAGKKHNLRIRNERGDWSEDAVFSLIIKTTHSGSVYVYGNHFAIDENDSQLLTATLDLLTNPIMLELDEIGDAASFDALIQLKDTTEQYSYGPPTRVQIFNTAFREGDAPPVIPPVAQIEIHESKKLVVLESGQIQVVDI
jgi:hypothetical protein